MLYTKLTLYYISFYYVGILFVEVEETFVHYLLMQLN